MGRVIPALIAFLEGIQTQWQRSAPATDDDHGVYPYEQLQCRSRHWSNQDPRWLRHAHIMVAVRAIGGVHRSLLVTHQLFVLNGSCWQSVVNAREPHRQDQPQMYQHLQPEAISRIQRLAGLEIEFGQMLRQAISAFVISMMAAISLTKYPGVASWLAQ
jgi:hypothetical protein